MSKREKIRGDLLRELIFFVYLRNKYDVKRGVEVSMFKKSLGYSSGGIDYALKYSGFFEIEKGTVKLSEKGMNYVRRELLPQYKIFNPIGYFFMMLGVLLILQWYAFTYLHTAIVFDFWAGMLLIVGGFVLRFFLLPLIYWGLRIQKK